MNIDYRGKSDLKSLVLAEPSEAFEDFFGSENLYSAFYVNELINYLIAQADESMEIFDLYKKCISNLKRNNQIEKILRDFELNILSTLGYEINFLSDYDSNEPIMNGLRYKYSPQSGFSKSEQGYDGKILNEINERKFSKNSLQACKEINRTTINYYFEELNIKSRIFFK